MQRIREVVVAVFVLAASAWPAAAQPAGSVTQSDIQRLQENVFQASSDVSALRSRDAARANQLQAELDDLRDEVIYLKVKLRKEGSLARAEYGDVRDRVEDLRTRARGSATSAYAPPTPAPPPPAPSTPAVAAPAPPAPAPAPAPVVPAPAPRPQSTPSSSSAAGQIPAGTQLDVRMMQTLNSGTAQVEDRFEATSLVDLNIDGRVVVPAGSVLRGVVSSVEPATRTNRTAKMTVTFDELTVDGRRYPIRATVTEAIQGEGMKGEVGRVGVGAGVGAIIGGLLGGFKGALAGILIGGGGTIAATEGKEVELPQGTILRVRFDSPASIGVAVR